MSNLNDYASTIKLVFEYLAGKSSGDAVCDILDADTCAEIITTAQNVETDERIQLTDTPISSIIKLAEGNLDALSILSRVLQEGSVIDPDAGFGHAVVILLNFDTYAIYGRKVCMLYNDVCGERLDRTIALVRATQLGFISESQLQYAIDNSGAGLDVYAVCAKVKAELPRFNFTESQW